MTCTITLWLTGLVIRRISLSFICEPNWCFGACRRGCWHSRTTGAVVRFTQRACVYWGRSEQQRAHVCSSDRSSWLFWARSGQGRGDDADSGVTPWQEIPRRYQEISRGSGAGQEAFSLRQLWKTNLMEIWRHFRAYLKMLNLIKDFWANSHKVHHTRQRPRLCCFNAEVPSCLLFYYPYSCLGGELAVINKNVQLDMQARALLTLQKQAINCNQKLLISLNWGTSWAVEAPFRVWHVPQRPEDTFGQLFLGKSHSSQHLSDFSSH